jgi:hypothetical protein
MLLTSINERAIDIISMVEREGIAAGGRDIGPIWREELKSPKLTSFWSWATVVDFQASVQEG